MNRRRNFKYFIRQIHLWLGLTSGLVVFIISITGCLFVFQDEISRFVHPGWFYAENADPDVQIHLSLSRLQGIAQKELGADKPIQNIVTYRDPNRSWEFMAYKGNDTALTYFGSLTYFESVYIDPHTGTVTGKRDYKYDFFNIVKGIHWSLLLGSKYGQPIVGYSVLIFVVMLITGLLLWWPKKWTKATRDINFKIKWKASFRRVNYDLHNVPGFYTLVPALILASTGLVMAFRWFTAFVFLITTGSTKNPDGVYSKSIVPPAVTTQTPGPFSDTAMAIDKAYWLANQVLPQAPRVGFSPALDKDAVIYATGYPNDEVYYGYDVLQVDKYTGKLISRQNNSGKRFGEKLNDMNYDIHVGAIGGLAGKLIAFIASLVCASLPITGFLIWYYKKYKKTSRRMV